MATEKKQTGGDFLDEKKKPAKKSAAKSSTGKKSSARKRKRIGQEMSRSSGRSLQR